ncbi:hypothetical protein LPC10_17700 [Methylorubrum sp. B1-46]|uniref:hypothetical protein n=1 Tax=Methylorubrum TaxID=2282523 RepID=UPI001E61F1B2|nr:MULTISPECIES: hypothetical protein [Methylorubrum]MCG5246873.1 hypothetical protein [Methylorubrum extorquens]UGB24765.1 hypothetical protein LPC10_17700 [Methylorubrum sp. B1-46]
MSHVSSTTPRARATDHAVVRYCQRCLGAVVDEGLDDQQALKALRTKGVDLAWVRARIAAVGGVILAAGSRTGDVVAFPEAMKFRVVDGVVVTVLARVAKFAPAGPASAVPPRPRSVLELGGAS